MIIEPEEVAEVQRHLSEVLDFEYNHAYDHASFFSNPQSPVFFAERPHLLLPAGYEDYRAIEFDLGTLRPRTRSPEPDIPGFEPAFPYEAFFRTPTGAWDWFEGIGGTEFKADGRVGRTDQMHLHFVQSNGTHRSVDSESWLDELRRIVAHPSPQTSVLALPSMWTPQLQRERASRR